LRIFRQFRHVRRRTQLRDQASGVPCGAGGQLFSLQEDHVFPPQLGEVVRDRAADDATADDDHAGMCWDVGHEMTPFGKLLAVEGLD
jgi:hypothetical protein